MNKSIIPITQIAHSIHFLRGQKVLLDLDLALLYEVPTGHLNRAVKRNRSRFPSDFMFRLSKKESDILKCQFGISSWGGRRGLPYAFTEQGVAMLSEHAELKRQPDGLEKKYDDTFSVVFDAIHQLMDEPKSGGYAGRHIGFTKDQ